ncbi:MAG: precorrin-4 C(11)-methyltransferase [Lachnospiraceae bacterium]|jgi:precorrin-4/cobalt-precorrin-4 C11-methyltransferase|nr:precorrin-4 C(11)-methyltransferase [Lachnospiraceae bacterium]
MVHFVGAGPGAPDLITLRGRRLLETADVIIYAGSLVNPELLSFAKEGCRIHNSACMNLEQVIEVMKQAEAEGKTTVRLHTGDPSVYGAIREQIDLLKRDGISYDVCPGVSSFFGAAASLACEYTLPEVSQSIIITRMSGRTTVPDGESVRSFAAHQATMILFLSVGMIEDVVRELTEGGYQPDTPAAVVYKATWEDEKIVRASLDELAEKVQAAGIKKTALIIVGKVLGDDYALSKLYDKHFTTEYRRGV